MSRLKQVDGTRIRQLRESRRLTQHDLASRLRNKGFGTTQTTVSRWETGQMPHSSVLPALADELGCTVEELFGETEDDEDSLNRDLTRGIQAIVERAVERAVKEIA